MPRFLIEGFAGSTGVNLNTREPFVGGPWAKVTGANPDILISLVNRARGNANQLARYVSAAVPESADYDVSGRTFRQSGVGGWWVTLRASTGADTCYAVGYTGSNWQIVRRVNGNATTLASVAGAWANNDVKPWRVKIRGTNPVTIELRDALVGGAVIASASDSAANRITAAGRVGLHLNGGTNTLFENRGYHVAMLVAAALPTDPRPRAPRPALHALEQRILDRPEGRERFKERARILIEAGVPSEWQVAVGGVTYTLSLPAGASISDGTLVSRDGETVAEGSLYIPEIRCTPTPPKPQHPGGHVWHGPPLKVYDGTVREEQDDDGDPVLIDNAVVRPLEAFRICVAQDLGLEVG